MYFVTRTIFSTHNFLTFLSLCNFDFYENLLVSCYFLQFCAKILVLHFEKEKKNQQTSLSC